MSVEERSKEMIAGGKIIFWTWLSVIAVGVFYVMLFGGQE